jgi:hypothetical protein
MCGLLLLVNEFDGESDVIQVVIVANINYC